MPEATSYVGPLVLPVPAGVTKQKIADPAVDALLVFAAYSIKQALDARLAKLTGTSADACPVANRFTFAPTETRGHHVRLPVPSLFCWWEGNAVREPLSVLHSVRRRQIWLQYIFGELPALDEMDRRSGLLNVVDAALWRMSDRQRDEGFSYGSGPLGQSLVEALGFGLWTWTWTGGEALRFGIDEGPSELIRRTIKRHSGRDYPTLKGYFEVEELVQPMQMAEADINRGIEVSVQASDGDGVGTTPIKSGVLDAPDGTQEL